MCNKSFAGIISFTVAVCMNKLATIQVWFAVGMLAHILYRVYPTMESQSVQRSAQEKLSHLPENQLLHCSFRGLSFNCCDHSTP